jgi:lysozyme
MAREKKTSQRGVELIMLVEGLKTEAYLCPAKVWTIGYGHTKGVRPGDKVSPREAEALLKMDLQWAEEAVRKNLKAPYTQGQFDAFVSLTFNIGETNLLTSTALRMFNSGHLEKVPDAFRMWKKGRGRILPGLIARREREIALFLGEE